MTNIRVSIGIKLALLISAVVVVIFTVATILLDRVMTGQLDQKMQEELRIKVQMVTDMIEIYDKILQRNANDLSGVLLSYYPEKISLEPGKSVQIEDAPTPVLRAGNTILNMNFDRVDEFTSITQAVSTIFVRKGDDFVRIATSLRNRMARGLSELTWGKSIRVTMR